MTDRRDRIIEASITQNEARFGEIVKLTAERDAETARADRLMSQRDAVIVKLEKIRALLEQRYASVDDLVLDIADVLDELPS